MNSEKIRKQKLRIPQLRGTIANKYKNRFAFGMLAIGSVFGVGCHYYCRYFHPGEFEREERTYFMPGLPVVPASRESDY